MSRSGCSARKTRGTRCSRRCGSTLRTMPCAPRSEEHTSELQSQSNLVCRLLLEKKTKEMHNPHPRRVPVYQDYAYESRLHHAPGVTDPVCYRQPLAAPKAKHA